MLYNVNKQLPNKEYNNTESKENTPQEVSNKAPSTTQVQLTSSTPETSQSNDQALSLIYTNSWTGLLHHRVAPNGLVSLIERLDYTNNQL